MRLLRYYTLGCFHIAVTSYYIFLFSPLFFAAYDATLLLLIFRSPLLPISPFSAAAATMLSSPIFAVSYYAADIDAFSESLSHSLR